VKLNLRTLHILPFCAFLALAMALSSALDAQNLTLEGQTGGFITPTAYTIYTPKGQFFSHPAIGFHFINASKVIGNIETFSVLESVANRAEVGYTRSVHQLGNDTKTSSSDPYGLDLSNLWNYNGMNIFNAKLVALKESSGGAWTPGVAVGGVVRTGDKFVSGAIPSVLGADYGVTVPAKSYTNGDVYVAVSKTRLKLPVPFLANVGWKATNATIYGIGGQATGFKGEFFGGIGIPLPLGHNLAVVPAVGATQEPSSVKNLGPAPTSLPPTSLPLLGGQVHLPTTLDYAVRITQKDNPHFAADFGIGQVAGMIGSTVLPTGLPAPYPATVVAPINLQARKVVGGGLSFRY
jgi:hypothetical protein